MLITKDAPTGIDFSIQQLQILLHNELLRRWGLNTDEAADTYRAYGRIYRNKKDNQYIAEVYEGAEEYNEVYWDDELSAISWFGQSSTVKFGIKSKASIHLVFFVNISKLKPAIQHRADEEIRNDVQRIIGRGLYGFTFESTELWIENVLKEYPGSRRDGRLAAVDMQPIHCFRLNLSLLYSTNNNCTTV
jgi:hypothetical protein